MKEDSNCLLSIEEKLVRDDDGTFCRTTVNQLNDYLYRVKQVMNVGCKPEEFEVLDRLKASIETAAVVVENVWKGVHG